MDEEQRLFEFMPQA